jgi:hypothetical protein
MPPFVNQQPPPAARRFRLSLEPVRIDPGSPRLRHRPSRRARALRLILVAILVGGVAGVGAIDTNAFGAGNLYDRLLAKIDRFIVGPPPPDRATLPTVDVTDPPATPSPNPTPTLPPPASGQPVVTPPPTPTPIPRVAVDVNIVANPNSVFIHEIKDVWCAPAGISIVLAILGHGDATAAREREIAGRVHEWETYADSHIYGWGPAAIVSALDAYGAKGYQIRAYQSRAVALRDSAKALSTTHSPVILIAWKGAHTWVMSGYRADADPTVFNDAKVSGTYILDPWYPTISMIWGPSDPPGTFQNSSEMIRNFLPWRQPDGRYPDRDGKFIVIIPTIPVG